jgi:ubiquinone/menaquinone biosynthesis C-methylase UbiE
VKRQRSINFLSGPFGTEYAWRPSWGLMERFYIRVFGLLDLSSRLRARIVLQELNTLQPKKVLDLGSGTGCYSFYLSRDSCTNVTGVEIDERRIAESSHIAKCLERRNLKFCYGSVDKCVQNFPPEYFDMGLAIEVLQYLSDVPLILRQTYRVLKPGGSLLGHVPVLGYLRPEEKTLFDDRKIQEMLCEANFQVIKIVPTIGGISGRLCTLYEYLSRSSVATGILFPFILIASSAFSVENPKGQYRFFVARKPVQTKTED